MIFAIFAALAEFERELIGERTRAGTAAARQRGVHIGRLRKLSGQPLNEARILLGSKGVCLGLIARSFGVHASTLRRALGDG